MLSCIINMVYTKYNNYAFVYYKHGSVQSKILILLWFAIYHMNAYSLNSAVFNVMVHSYLATL